MTENVMGNASLLGATFGNARQVNEVIETLLRPHYDQTTSKLQLQENSRKMNSPRRACFLIQYDE